MKKAMTLVLSIMLAAGTVFGNPVSSISGEVEAYAADHITPDGNLCNSTYRSYQHIAGSEYGRQIGSHRLSDGRVCMIYSVEIAHKVWCSSCKKVLNTNKVLSCMTQHSECGSVTYNHSGL